MPAEPRIPCACEVPLLDANDRSDASFGLRAWELLAGSGAPGWEVAPLLGAWLPGLGDDVWSALEVRPRPATHYKRRR